jgi:hypothetical protein
MVPERRFFFFTCPSRNPRSPQPTSVFVRPKLRTAPVRARIFYPPLFFAVA